MTKTSIRKLYKEKRIELTDSELEKLTDLVLIQFQALRLNIPDNILSYLPFAKYAEIDLMIIEEYCKFKNPNCSFSYPVVDEVSDTIFAISTSSDQAFAENKYGISEPFGGEVISPKDIDMVFVPLLAYDEAGYRVGYGKGYYDKFLATCNKDIVKIGFSFFETLDTLIEKDGYDIPMNYCITPSKVYHF